MNGDGGGSYVSQRGSARKPSTGVRAALFSDFLPFHLSLTRARVLPSVIFGIEHCYQGVAGAGQTTPIGLLLATMLLATGNLLLPMAVHAMLDCA
jgi:membrane protease YdiL (CAAX protease family)